MKVSNKGLDLIKSYEKFVPTPYLCPAGKSNIGYGHVILPGENFADITEQDACELLAKDCALAERCINKNATIQLSQNEFDALVSFVFNIGVGNFTSSTLLKLINQNKSQLAAAQFERWIFVNKLPSKGLLNRRLAEKSLFLTP